ncbi:MAG: NAD(P)(+) transhydrogenase (Re/Si-specific) subunit beta, partial [Alphaproteobacteria bacterium]|nr:NAD(P)(+) transhydrogenase (Re/Si-specific) subunit beta [Alphaproteobacteria bacterium]
MSAIVSLAYLISGICFILSLRGLSSPESARKGNMFGIFGMTLAVVTTLCLLSAGSYFAIGLAILLGGGIGAIVAKKIQMTALPQ